MAFDIIGFVRNNKRFFIWTAFFILLYLVRGLFGLVFLTFILCFIFSNIIGWLSRKIKAPRRLWTVLVYIVFVAMVTFLLSLLAPKLGSESKLFLRQIPDILSKVQAYLEKMIEQQPYFAPAFQAMKDSISLEHLIGIRGEAAVNIIMASLNEVTNYFSFFVLGTFFSFMILLDFPNLKARTLALRNTRLKEVYKETARSVVRFAEVVGAAFQAQILIAIINTILTALGLWILDIHPISLLCTIVFFCGLIPVLGVFISSAPILLLAFNSGGLGLFAWALLMIILVHTVEAYFLNPNIFSAVFKINPVLTLIILYIGHKLFGMWGVLLGVPVSVYIYRYAILGANGNEKENPETEDDELKDAKSVAPKKRFFKRII